MYKVDIKFLKGYVDAWNKHDIDALMKYMTNDCIFETASGEEAWGTRVQGADEVRKHFESVWKDIADARWSQGKHFVSADRGLSEWLFTGTTNDGKKIAMQGCDVFTFRAGKIYKKCTYLKKNY
ncbi:MAG: nuclear transport factor 2 family protein [Gammaproteobacteria bacterium]|nr:nuclear transport factor 2 family protein [Gammaproteobacteria bacterium]